MKYIRGFDGLRAISILLVLITHLGLYNYLGDYDFINERIKPIVSGFTGVLIFFSISGFLITTILLREKNTYGRIGFKNFYSRRFLRLLPPLILFYAAIILLIKFDFLQGSKTGLLFSIFYLYNFVPNEFYTKELGHTWSLAVEEQFYLLWPFAVAFVYRLKNILKLILIVVLLCGAAYYILPEISFYSEGKEFLLKDNFKLYRWFIPAVGAIMIGAAGAVVLDQHATELRGRLKGNHFILFIAALFFLSPLYFPSVLLTLYPLTEPVGTVLFLMWLYYNQESNICGILENKALRYIGKISYGIYVYQGLFLTTGPAGQLFIQQFPQNLLLTFAAAILSYELLEKPVLKLKNKFRRIEIGKKETKRAAPKRQPV